MTVSGPPGSPVPSGHPSPAPTWADGAAEAGHTPPAPPPGPGVTPPFAAPPTEGRTVRVWLGLGAAALAVVLCCGGGGAALVGLVVSGTRAINEQARVVVGNYLDALKNKDYSKAYDLLCDQVQSRESQDEFQRRAAAAPDIASFHVGQASTTRGVTVPVDVTYAEGGAVTQRYALAQDGGTGQLEVCGVS